jgi:threonine/homoserine/homoserine lactone efflux protein
MFLEIVAFTVAAIGLLGSPGPGIGALVAVGRSFERAAALRFYGAMQIGLAIAAGLSAFGLTSLLAASTLVRATLTVLATAYLLWLAWTIASAPVGSSAIGAQSTRQIDNRGAFLLGVANPKAYLAFGALFASFTLLPMRSGVADGALKWVLCVGVMMVVDFAWLALGMAFGRIALPSRTERLFNYGMATAVVGACIAVWLQAR